jgi:SAM-dependent methyltransferase
MEYYPPGYGAHSPLPGKLSFRELIKLLALERDKQYGIKRSIIRQLGNLVALRVGLDVRYIPGGRLLDIGCGNGHSVRLYQLAGWDAWGVEPNEAAARYAQAAGLQVLVGTLEQARFPPDYFDVVTVYQVLEHVASPRDLLAEVYRVLKPGGQLLISVPNIECYDFGILQAEWFPLEVPRHFYHFSLDTLSQLLRQAGFLIERVKPQYMLLTCTWNDYRRLIKRLARGLQDAEISWHEAVWQLLNVFVRGFVFKPVAFMISHDNRARRFAYFLNFYARKPAILSLTKKENA